MIQVAQCNHSVLKYIREAAESQNGMDMKITTSYLLLAMQMEDGQEPNNVSTLWKLEKKIQGNSLSFHLPKKKQSPANTLIIA